MGSDAAEPARWTARSGPHCCDSRLRKCRSPLREHGASGRLRGGGDQRCARCGVQPAWFECGRDCVAVQVHRRIVANAEAGDKAISNEELLELDVDLLVPAAIEDVITPDNAAKVKARVILELANGPVTSDADAMLKERGIIVVPDILANAAA